MSPELRRYGIASPLVWFQDLKQQYNQTEKAFYLSAVWIIARFSIVWSRQTG